MVETKSKMPVLPYMETKPLTSEAIALTEKKMEMSLDDIIKMSKNNGSKRKKPPRISNKNQSFFWRGAQPKSSKVQRFTESRSSIRQGALARRRSNLVEKQFPLTAEAAWKAVNVPARNMVVNMNRTRAAPAPRKSGDDKTDGKGAVLPKPRQTLDARFASIREHKATAVSQQPFRNGANPNASRGRGQRRRQQQQPQWKPQGRGGPGHGSSGHRYGNSRR